MNYLALAIKVAVVGACGFWLIHTDAGMLGLFGILLGALATLVGGWRTGLAVSLACFLVAGVGITVQGQAVLSIVLIALIASACAYTARIGKQAAWLPVVILAAIAFTVPAQPGPAWGQACLVAIGALVGVGVCRIPPSVPAPAEQVALTPTGAAIYASLVGLTTLLAAWAVVEIPLPHGYWLIAALATCALPSPAKARAKAINRQVGTVVGALVGLGISAAVSSPSWLLALAIGLLLLSVASMSRGYAVTVGFAAAAIVVLASISGSASVIAGERIGLTLAGGALVVLVSVAMAPLLDRIGERVPLLVDPAATPPATSSESHV